MMWRLAFFAAGLLLCVGCSLRTLSKGKYVWPATDGYAHFFKKDTLGAVVFRTSIEVLKDRYSGLLAVKHMGAGEYRCILTTQTGLKVFDYTLTDRNYKVNYGISMLKKDMVAKRMSLAIWGVLLRKVAANGMYVLDENGVSYLAYRNGKMTYELTVADIAAGNVLAQNIYVRKQKKVEAVFTGHDAEMLPDSCVVNMVGFPMKAVFRRLAR